jgi:hypothetical protein
MRASGKSVLCQYLISLYGDCFDEIFVVSTTESQNGFYSTFINPKNIFTEFSSEWLSSFYSKLEEESAKKKGINVLLLLDDCGSEPEFKKDKTVLKAFTRGRHIGLSIIILQQYIYQISPACRGNCDYLLVGQSNTASQEVILKEFRMGNITKKQFIDIYKKSTCNHYFLVINCSSVEDNDDLNTIYGKIKARI